MTIEQDDGFLSFQTDDIEAVRSELLAIREYINADMAAPQPLLDAVHPNYRHSARNLLHYLSLRRHDIRPLQMRLAALGLSSLGRAESHVLVAVDRVLEILHRLTQCNWEPPQEKAIVDLHMGQRLLAEHTETMFGPATNNRNARIMVTMPSEAASNDQLVYDLLKQGMSCMRINCAHDSPDAWLRMIENLRRAEDSLQKNCRVVMDLAGPKLRTGPIEPGQAVLRVRPQRNSFGKVTASARLWLSAGESSAGESPQSESGADACLSVTAEWLGRLDKGDKIQFVDARNAKRKMVVTEVSDRGVWAEMNKTAYIVPGTTLQHQAESNKGDKNETSVGNFHSGLPFITLQCGDRLTLTRDLQPGQSAKLDSDGRVISAASIGCTLPDVFNDVLPGQSILFDDGKIGAVVEKIESSRVQVLITQARPGGEKLRVDKGINLPESNLQLDALTETDLKNLAFVAEHADVVEMSFANCARDVQLLQQHLTLLGDRRPAIVLKVETCRAIENLSEMLLTAMRWPSCGVMIARGDMAVECGFERLAEVQEEILWICEAAHVPVIWATQVLENLAKNGMPSRAEITDAAMGERAECVMLNKGPHIVDAVQALDDILRRMETHQIKKSAMLRKLHMAHKLPDQLEKATA